MIIFINYKDRIKRVTLSTRKTLRTRIERKAEIPVELSKKTNSTKERTTITKSKQFIRSFTYSFIPRPISLRNISIVNIIVKI